LWALKDGIAAGFSKAAYIFFTTLCFAVITLRTFHFSNFGKEACTTVISFDGFTEKRKD
jgi:hypothetical protein